MLKWFHKSGLAGKSHKILQWCEWQADKDRDAREMPKLSQTDEDALRDICGLRGFGQKDSRL